MDTIDLTPTPDGIRYSIRRFEQEITRSEHLIHVADVIPDELWRSLDSAEDELSEEAGLTFVRYWMEHAPGDCSRIDRLVRPLL